MEVSLSSLPFDLVLRIADLVLANDAVDYIKFRAVCSEWRSCSTSPQGLDSCFHPRNWIMLHDGNANLNTDYTAHHQRFLNPSTGQRLHLHLPELEFHSVLSDSDDLLVLVDNSTHIVRLFNPFTRHLADFPPLPNIYENILPIEYMIDIFYSCISTGSCPTIVLYTCLYVVAFFVKPGYSSWKVFRFEARPFSMLFFNDRFYFVNETKGIHSIHDQEQNAVKRLSPHWTPIVNEQYYLHCLVEYNGRKLVVYKKGTGRKENLLELEDRYSCNVFMVDSMQRSVMSEVRDVALFLGFNGRNLAVPLKNYSSSIKSNSIYFLGRVSKDPIVVCNII